MILRLPKGSRKKIAKNFRAWEFDCHCSRCKETLIDEKLIEELQKLRDKLGLPVTIISGYRCNAHNRDVGGVPKSQHKLGRAADIVVYGLTPYEVWIDCKDFKGLGYYPTRGFVHVDVRSGRKARWRSFQ